MSLVMQTENGRCLVGLKAGNYKIAKKITIYHNTIQHRTEQHNSDF